MAILVAKNLTSILYDSFNLLPRGMKRLVDRMEGTKSFHSVLRIKTDLGGAFVDQHRVEELIIFSQFSQRGMFTVSRNFLDVIFA
jgi:hypothetical protein